MNKFGLYAIDGTIDNKTLEESTTYMWRRTNLYYNGKVVNKTVSENNKFGTYVSNDSNTNKLVCNGNVVATSDNNAPVEVKDDTIKYDDVVLQSDNLCVNITLDKYNKLRAGVPVTGYTRYNSNLVYYITNSNTPKYYNPELIEGHEDVIYNSFIPVSEGGILDSTIINGVPKAASTLLTNATFMDPRYTPEIAMRPFNCFIDEQEDGAVLELEYYVDTYDYSSNCPKDLGNGSYRCVGEKFTTIVEDENLNEIYRGTTYAGQFKIKTAPIKNITGKSSFSIRTIDDTGRESLTLFFEIYIKPLPKPTDKGIYQVTEQDLIDYHITTFYFDKNNIEDNPEYRHEMRTKYFKGYINKLGLEKLMIDKKADHYSGIRLFNPNTKANKTLNDNENLAYLVDVHTVRNQLNYNNYRLAKEADYPNTEFAAPAKYYLLEVANSSTLRFKNPFTHKEIDPSYKDNSGHKYRIEDLEQCVIKIDTEFTLHDEDTGTDKTYKLNPGETPYEWIRRDGAHVARNNNDKILVAWTYNYSTEQGREEVYGGYSAAQKMLRIKDLNSICTYYTGKVKTSTKFFKDGSQYCYGAWRSYYPDSIKNRNLVIPDNFTLDCNFCTIVPTYACDLRPEQKLSVFGLVGSENVHIENAKIIGVYGDELVKDAFLQQNVQDQVNVEWEGAGCISMNGARLCSFKNVIVENSAGYEFAMGTSYDTYENGSSDIKENVRFDFDTTTPTSAIGFVVNNNNLCGDDLEDAIIKYDNQSALPEDSDDRAKGATDICLATSKLVNMSNIYKVCAQYAGGPTRSFSNRLLYIRLQEGAYYGSFRVGKFPICFAHCYDSNNRHIRTYKVQEHLPLIVPKNTKKLNVTAYICCDNNGVIVNSGKIVGIATISAAVCDVTSSCLLENCTVRKTKSSSVCGSSTNVTIKDCTFIDSCAIAYAFNFNLAIHNVEENPMICNNLSYINCKAYKIPTNQFTMRYRARLLSVERFNVIGCSNISFTGVDTKYYIANSNLRGIGFIANRNFFHKTLGIVKNTTSNSEYDETDTMRYGFTGIDTGAKETSTGNNRNFCDEPLTINVSINDCLLNIRRNSVPLYGNTHKVKGVAYDSYGNFETINI